MQTLATPVQPRSKGKQHADRYYTPTYLTDEEQQQIIRERQEEAERLHHLDQLRLKEEETQQRIRWNRDQQQLAARKKQQLEAIEVLTQRLEKAKLKEKRLEAQVLSLKLTPVASTSGKYHVPNPAPPGGGGDPDDPDDDDPEDEPEDDEPEEEDDDDDVE